ncbi:MAG: ATP-binding protein [Gammaproteobacteria bacterium]
MSSPEKNFLAGKCADWLMEIAPEAMLLVDPAGCILQGNSAAETRFGFSNNEFPALTLQSLIPGGLPKPDGDTAIACTTGRKHDVVCLCKDGGEFYADVNFTLLEEGALLVAIHDITDRREALLASLEFSESILATIHEPVVVMDSMERVVTANRAFYRIFQLTDQETLGQPFFELNDQQWDIPELRQLLAEELPGKHRIDAFEMQHEFPGIGSRTVLIGARLIEGKDERTTLTLLSFLNITERNRLEAEQARMIQELESANAELNNFAYVVSHDLKAPLRAIGSLADWIATDQKDRLDDEGQEHLRLLIQRVRRMNALIDGVLHYSRIGRLHEEVVAVDLNELVHEVIDSLAPPPHITVSIASELPTIQAEKTAIQQVLQNLIANAIRYQDKAEGRIAIDFACEGNDLRLSVTDNGPGIEARHFDRIFQLFQTLNPRDRVESTGVGLAIVKKIVEQSGGRIGVESVRGQGSTFFFTLPQTTIKMSKGNVKS